MSADNGIYILKTKDQIRVIHAQAIDNLVWSYVDENFWQNHPREYVPTRIVEYFGGSKHTRNMHIAKKIANYMLQEAMICEYGIVHLRPYDKTWKELVAEAKAYAKLEVQALEEYTDDYHQISRQNLLEIINGKYD